MHVMADVHCCPMWLPSSSSLSWVACLWVPYSAQTKGLHLALVQEGSSAGPAEVLLENGKITSASYCCWLQNGNLNVLWGACLRLLGELLCALLCSRVSRLPPRLGALAFFRGRSLAGGFCGLGRRSCAART